MDSLRILLANPPISYQTERPTALPVLGLPIIAAVLNNAGHKAEVIDLGAIGKKMAYIEVDKYDAIGLTTMTCNIQGFRSCISDLRSKNYKGIVIAGGVYATMFPNETLSLGVDLVITGECEGNIVGILESGKVGIVKGERMPIEDIPAPAWDYHTPNINSYFGNVSIIRPMPAITQFTRGCPYDCIFCENAIFKKQVTRYRPPENIERELQYLYDHGFHNVFIYDDETFGCKMTDGWMKEVADRIERFGFNMATLARCSEKYITPELMKDAKRAGINTIFWGVESLSQKVLDAIKKKITLDDIWHTLRTAKEAGIKNSLFMQIGSYTETEKEAKETEKGLSTLYRQGLVDHMQVFVNAVMPGTELEKIGRAEGWYKEIPDGWNKIYKVMHSRGTPWMSQDKIYYWQERYRKACPTVKL